MNSTPDECQIEAILSRQLIGADIFTPFLITRLKGDRQATEAELSVILRDIGGLPKVEHVLRLRWDSDSLPTLPLGVQEKTVTEWAACGIACVVVPFYTGLQILSVADEGDRFDYWVWDGQEAFGLEVSGTLSGERMDMEARHRAKVRQLRENPHGVDGFVVVAGLATREVILSRHRFEEEAIL